VLVERYQEPVFALVGRILLGGGAVEDVAQETFVRVYHGLSRFGADGRLNLTAWILTIAARLAIDEVRRRRAGRTDYEDLIDHADERARADAGLERRRIGGAIVRAVDALAPEYRAAFLLYEIHGLDYEEIARSLDIDLGTVKSRLSRARAALRAALSGLHDET
jgi:RNA polymerase sigma-70 factor (ECF subfamily)